MTAFFDDSPGGDAGALAWPGPAGTDRPRMSYSGALEQKLSARWALLEETGVAAVHGSAFCYPGHFRIAYANATEELRDACTRIRQFCEGLH